MLCEGLSQLRDAKYHSNFTRKMPHIDYRNSFQLSQNFRYLISPKIFSTDRSCRFQLRHLSCGKPLLTSSPLIRNKWLRSSSVCSQQPLTTNTYYVVCKSGHRFSAQYAYPFVIWLCNFSHHKMETIFLVLESGLAHATCFGQWDSSKYEASRELDLFCCSWNPCYHVNKSRQPDKGRETT